MFCYRVHLVFVSSQPLRRVRATDLLWHASTSPSLTLPVLLIFWPFLKSSSDNIMFPHLFFPWILFRKNPCSTVLISLFRRQSLADKYAGRWGLIYVIFFTYIFIYFFNMDILYIAAEEQTFYSHSFKTISLLLSGDDFNDKCVWKMMIMTMKYGDDASQVLENLLWKVEVNLSSDLKMMKDDDDASQVLGPSCGSSLASWSLDLPQVTRFIPWAAQPFPINIWINISIL